MLHEQIKFGIKEAMMAKDALRLKAFRAMSATMKDLKGKADGAVVKEVVDSLF